ncbi:TPA: 3-isopropylmalate dehydratase large subunit [Candidatus Galligastranaerophilus intestinavium]|uniref:3-isopropylmalate dehydratase large subunit n=1 Tax=Candidatus Galligastranaerophilus intestinavium TaxID=2840836 RepID=A0A9D1FKZ0_9BACT|nr:3-isopropylmalate dehydratase large subunit [Candidatus Galligastranaerophilus intestinavium]
MTITEKIFAAHCGKDFVQAGELISAKVDITLANDITGPIAISEFRKIGVENVFDPSRVVFVPDHFVPNKDIKSAQQAKIVRDFSREQNLVNYFEVGRMGIEHALLPDKGIVTAGDLVIGADSHTCTYGALGAFSTGVGSTDLGCTMASGETWFRVPSTIKVEFFGTLNKWVSAKDLILHLIGDIGVDGALYKTLEIGGEVIENMQMDGRFTICNMAIEAGAKNGIIVPDEITKKYLLNRSIREPKFYTSDENATYEKVLRYDVSKIEPTVAKPHLPENTCPISEIGNIKIDQAVIGSCTNGRLSDLEVAAKILDGRKVHPDVRLIVFPGTQEIYLDALKLGYIEAIIKAGGAVSTPTCGPCLGGHCGILAKGERAISTTNRNFVGRMGHPESEVYLSSPAVAAASAILGKISSPEEL